MKPLFAMILLGAALALPAAQPQSLFDGRTFKGWDGDTNKWWHIREGCIVGGSLKEKVPHNDFLATTRSYTNFVLRLKFRLLGTNGFINSGVQIRSQRVPNDHEMAGYQCDLGDPSWWGSIYDESRRNKLMAQSDMAAINKVLKRQEWNDYVIRAEGRRIRTYINGVLGVDYTEADAAIVQWGRLGLQVHGGGAAEVWFKDLEIEELPALPESPLSPKEQKASFQLPPGFEIDLIAAEPDLPKPITVAFDDAGRMWSITAVEYPVDANENRSQAEGLFQQGGRDKILVFDPIPSASPSGASRGPPAFSKARVFAEGLVMPLGVLPYKDGAIVQYGSEVRLLRDTDGDGKADKTEVLLSGFGIQDSHLFPHQFTRAPGGWLYLAQGAFNYSKVRTTDGVVVQYDQTKLARFRPDGSAFEILTHGPCNIWGLVINAWGETFIQEANDYGYPVIHFQPGINVPGCGDRTFTPYAPRHPSIADFRMGGTGLSGLALSEDSRAFPEPWNDVMFVANPIVRQVQAVKIHRHGSGYTLERLPDFLSSLDEWFRPVAIHFGPDGGLYVVDWYNKIISHNEVPRNHPERDKSRGRIWRVRHSAAPAADLPNVAGATTPQLLAHLTSRNGWEWRAALNQISDRKAAALTSQLIRLATTPSSQGFNSKTDPAESASWQIRALWALESLDSVESSTLRSLLKSPDRNVRREAVRVAGALWPAPDVLSLVASLAEDSDHQVRAEVIRGVSQQVAPWKQLILEGTEKRPDPELAPAAIEVLVRMAKPALPEAHKPGPGYERAFERYLIRASLERHPAALAAFLNNPAAQALPVENRRLACASLRDEAAAQALNALIKTSKFQPADEEWIVLQRHLSPAELGALYPVIPWPAVTGAAVRRSELIQPPKDHRWLLEAARQVLRQDATPPSNPEDQTLALQAVRTFKIKDAEPEVVALLTRATTQPKMKIAGLQTLREIQPESVEAIDALASSATETVEVRNEAVATLAASRHPQAASKLLARWPALPTSLRSKLVRQLASSKAGAEILLAGFTGGMLLAEDLPMSCLKDMRTLLGEDPVMNKLWNEASARMQPVLRLDGGNDDYVSSKITLQGPFTVETWINLDPGISNLDGILGHAGSADLNFHAERFRFYAGDSHGDVVIATKKVAPNQWTHLAVSRDAQGEFRLYVNGELDAVGTKRVTETFANLDIGRTIPTAGGTAGSLAEFRIWNKAQSAEEILSQFDRSFAGAAPKPRLVLAVHGADSLPGPLRGQARMEGTLDAPPFLTAAAAQALDGLMQRHQQLAQSQGNPGQGKKVFETACMICHQVGGQGRSIAPPLDGAGHRGVDGLLRAILTPNAAIESGYRKFQVQTTDNELAEGYLVSQDAGGVLLRQPNAGDVRIPADHIKRAGFSRVSLMPEGLLESMEPRQVSDLFAFLLSLK